MMVLNRLIWISHQILQDIWKAMVWAGLESCFKFIGWIFRRHPPVAYNSDSFCAKFFRLFWYAERLSGIHCFSFCIGYHSKPVWFLPSSQFDRLRCCRFFIKMPYFWNLFLCRIIVHWAFRSEFPCISTVISFWFAWNGHRLGPVYQMPLIVFRAGCGIKVLLLNRLISFEWINSLIQRTLLLIGRQPI